MFSCPFCARHTRSDTSFQTQAMSYDSPSLFNLSLCTLPPSNSNDQNQTLSVTAQGANFGSSSYTQAARGGGTAAETTRWLSDTSLLIRFATGFGGSLVTAITSSSIVGSRLNSLSYSPPFPPEGGKGNMPGVPNVLFLQLSGGSSLASPSVRIGGTACVATVWMTDTAVSCRSVAGVGGTISVVLTAAVQGEELWIGQSDLHLSVRFQSTCTPASTCVQVLLC